MSLITSLTTWPHNLILNRKLDAIKLIILNVQLNNNHLNIQTLDKINTTFTFFIPQRHLQSRLNIDTDNYTVAYNCWKVLPVHSNMYIRN